MSLVIIEEDENTVFAKLKLVFVEEGKKKFPWDDEPDYCELCALKYDQKQCEDLPCSSDNRSDGKEGYFKAELVEQDNVNDTTRKGI